MAFDQFIEPIGTRGLLHVAANHFTHQVNVNRDPARNPVTVEDLLPWSRKTQIQQTGEFASREEALAFLNG